MSTDPTIHVSSEQHNDTIIIQKMTGIIFSLAMYLL